MRAAGLGRWLSAVIALVAGNPVLANNITISDFFSGEGPQMAASPAACGEVETQAFHQAGTISVSGTGSYELADAGNLLGFSGTGQGVVDIVINIYEGSFDPGNPASNRIDSIDEGEPVTLEAGKSYTLVVQPFCANESGVFGIVVRGSGVISGAGFESAAGMTGQHTLSDPSATFPHGIGTHRYDVSEPVQIGRTGIYYFGDIGINFNAGVTLLAYKNSFNPSDTSANLAGMSSFAGSFLLSSDTTYVFVAVDEADLFGNWQYTLFPPGVAGLNASLRGAWVTPGVEGSGVLMEVGDDTGIVFLAWFTFPDEASAVLSRQATTAESGSSTGAEADLGSADQRWLTGFGAIPDGGSQVDLSFENTTGGSFNSPTPKPITDSNYGTGSLEVLGCDEILISYDLPDGVSGSAGMVRAIPDGSQDCLEAIDAAPITP